MSPVTRIELLPGVHLTAVHTGKFKSSLLSISLLAPLSTGTAAANALVPYLLHRGCKNYPDMQSISGALDNLYGGSLEGYVRKKGEVQCLSFVGSFLDDAYTLDGSAILDQATGLMGQLLLDPVTEEGVFRKDYTEQEKTHLIDKIRGEVNDKRSYASLRVVREMCDGEPYGVSRLGTEAEVAALTPETVWEAYQNLISTAPVELFYCGSADPQRVAESFRKALGDLPRVGYFTIADTSVLRFAGTVRRVEESLDVAQGKLTMGLRTGGITAASPEYPALMLCNALFGGTTTSKLFLNVREKLSLCYYASSVVHKYKGIMVVSSGVEFADAPRAEEEILRQLEVCRRGEFEPWEVEGGRANLISGLRTMLDSQGRQEDWWLGQAIFGLTESPEELAERLKSVTVDQAVAAAKALSLDTVYFLKGAKA